jgi:DnaA-homolog protein
MQAILSLEIPYQPQLCDIQIGSNAAAWHAVQQWAAAVQASHQGLLPSTERALLCWGGVGVGKSALALALENTTGALRLNETSAPRQFDAATHNRELHAVVIDNIDQLDEAQACAAFNLYNHSRATPHRFFWASSRVPPSHMTNLLPDLSSRLSWGLVYELFPLSDSDSIAVLQAQALRLGFVLGGDTAQYLLLRLERNLTVLVEHLSNLNQYALKLKKPVTSHLVQQWYTHVYIPALALQRARIDDDRVESPSSLTERLLFDLPNALLDTV